MLRSHGIEICRLANWGIYKSIVATKISYSYCTYTKMSNLADVKPTVCKLEIKPHWDALTDKERLYAHHLSRASHWGTRTVLRQVSPESENIFDLILAVHNAVNGDYDALVAKADVSSDVVEQYLAYSTQFLGNLGNYKSFGDSKFVPRIAEGDFAKIASVDSKSTQLFNDIRTALFSVEPPASTLLGYPSKGHVTAYYGGDGITEEEIKQINLFTSSKGLLPENSRLFKTGPKEFVFKIASALSCPNGEFEDSYQLPNGLGTLKLEYGDSSKEFTHIAEEMKSAIAYTANEHQKKTIEAYYLSFYNGSMEQHKESQRNWVLDKGPKVESNIGFIETYRDPAGIRGEWEGLVATVNQEQTKKFGVLVSQAGQFIDRLPWPKDFEKSLFSPPDYTSLEVLTFAGSGIPAGINIPNYDDIRTTIGFKNVSLGNILSAKAPDEKITFLGPEDAVMYEKLRGPAFEVQVGIHELLGHGSGKLLTELPDGTFNFNKENPPMNPLTNEPVKTYYKKDQTWSGLFGPVAGSYEECRAESVAMYLCPDKNLLKIFGHTESSTETGTYSEIPYISYLMMARAGLVGLEFWDPNTGKWGQPHMQARYAITNVFLRAGQDFLKFDYTKEDYSDLVVKLDASKIESVGHKAVGEFLQKLHIYKMTGDVENGVKFYNEITTVTPEMAKFRDIVLANKLPRKQFVQPNTVLNDGKAELVEYDPTFNGMIQSFIDRRV